MYTNYTENDLLKIIQAVTEIQWLNIEYALFIVKNSTMT